MTKSPNALADMHIPHHHPVVVGVTLVTRREARNEGVVGAAEEKDKAA